MFARYFATASTGAGLGLLRTFRPRGSRGSSQSFQGTNSESRIPPAKVVVARSISRRVLSLE